MERAIAVTPVAKDDDLVFVVEKKYAPGIKEGDTCMLRVEKYVPRGKVQPDDRAEMMVHHTMAVLWGITLYEPAAAMRVMGYLVDAYRVSIIGDSDLSQKLIDQARDTLRESSRITTGGK